jgi:group I intron endonuclease
MQNKVILCYNFLYLYDSSLLFLSVLPVIRADWRDHVIVLFENAKEGRDKLLSASKGKSGLYIWINNLNGKTYIGQASDLGGKKNGRLNHYYRPSFISDTDRGKSLIRGAIKKYGLENLSIGILEYCSVEELDKREQYWFNLLIPAYNILTFSRSSRGYKHTLESLEKMRGPRPHFSPSLEQREAIAQANKNREYNQKFRDNVSKLKGMTVFVYTANREFLEEYSSISRAKKAYGITMHHNTFKKRVERGEVIAGYIFSFSPAHKIFPSVI